MKNVRMVFSKAGNAKYISHLDLARTMARVLRRAALPVWYTEGFNRHPYITFASPLSLGVEGMRETMDFRLEEDVSEGELLSRVNAVMPVGLQAVSVAEAVAKPGALSAARYRMSFSCIAEPIHRLLSQPSISVEKRTKQKTIRTLDIKPAFADAAVVEEGDRTVMTVTLPNSSNETVNPGLFVAALSRAVGEDVPCDIVRMELLLPDGSPFR